MNKAKVLNYISNFYKYKKIENGLYVFTFHSIGKVYGNHLKQEINIEFFSEFLNYLSQNFIFLNPENINKINIKNNKYCFLTFDDGYSNIINIISILERYNAYSIFFLCPDLIGKKVTIEQIRQNKSYSENILNKEIFFNYHDLEILKESKNIIIGSHTNNHVKLENIKNINKLEYEITNSKKKLEKIFNKPINSFSFPWGKFNEKSFEIAKKNYKYLFTTDIGINNPINNFNIKRLSMDINNKYYYKLLLSNLYSVYLKLRQKRFLQH